MIEFGEINVLTLILILLVVAGIIYYYFYKHSKYLFFLRLCVYILVFVVLIQPMAVVRERTKGKPVCAVLADNSLSMGIKDPVARIELLKQFIAARMPSWRNKADIRLYVFSGITSLSSEERVTGWKASGKVTHMGRAIREIGQELSGKLSSMIIISDGRDNGTDDAVKEAETLNIPVFTIGVGSREHMNDILVSDIQTPDFVFKNTPCDVKATIRGYGFQGKTVPVRLYQQQELIATRNVEIPSKEKDTAVSFRIIPKNVGTFTYRISIPQFPQEISTTNNTAEFSIDVIREKLRVLYICGQPGYEYAFLREVLKNDPAIELVSFVILRNPENIEFVADHELSLIPFPTHEIFLEKLFSFDALIFENFTYARFGVITPYLENIRRFVIEKGGSFIMIGGKNSFGSGQYQHTPIEDLIPFAMDNTQDVFEEKPCPLRITHFQHPIMLLDNDDKKNRALWSLLPLCMGYNTCGIMKEGAMVLAEHAWVKNKQKTLPCIVAWERGKGRIMCITTNTTWKWALGGVERKGSVVQYTRFWRNAVRWVTQAEDMKRVLMNSDKRHYTPGDEVRLQILVKDEAYDPQSDAVVNVYQTGPDGVKKEIPCYYADKGIFHAEFEPWAIGVYQLTAEAYDRSHQKRIGLDTRKIDVGSFSKETVELNLNDSLLKEIAQKTGGIYSTVAAFDETSFFKSLTVRYKGEIVRKRLIWNNPIFFTMIIVLLGFEWFFRRRYGLP